MSPEASMCSLQWRRGRETVLPSIQNGLSIRHGLPQLIILFLHLSEVSIDDD